MTKGYMKGHKTHFISIYAAHKNAKSLQVGFKETPKILTTHNTVRPEHPLSVIGKNLNTSSFVLTNKYLVFIDSIFFIKNEINLWENICTNGIFDIWHPEAPFNNLDQKKTPMILLLRLFEVDYDFSNEIMVKVRFDEIRPRAVNIIKPVITNQNFLEIKDTLKNTVSKHCVTEEEQVFDTTLI